MHRRRANADPRLAAAERIWRQNRCIKASTIVVYRQWVSCFGRYCRACELKESEELTRAGVERFSRWWHAAHRTANSDYILRGAHSALGTWVLALRTLGQPLSVWNTAASQPPVTPLLREFGEYLRNVRNRRATIRRPNVSVVTNARPAAVDVSI